MNKKQLPTGVRVLLGFISFLLCIVLFVCSLVTILVADLGLLTSKGGMQKLIQDILFSTSAPARPGFAAGAVLPGRNPIRLEEGSVIPSIPEGAGIPDGIVIPEDLLSGIAGSLTGGNVQDALVDTLFGILEENSTEAVPFTKEEVAEFVDKSTIPEFISDKVSGIMTDVINGEVSTTITKEDVMDLLEENKPLIEDTLKTEIPDEVIESVGAIVEESNISQVIQEEVAAIVGVEPPAPANPGNSGNAGSNDSDISGGTPSLPNKPIFRPSDVEVLEGMVSGSVSVEDMRIADILALVRIVTSPAVLIGCIAVCLLLSALLFLTNWGRPNAALRCSGIPCFLAGLLFLLPSAVAQFVPSLFAPLGIAGTAIRQILSLAGTISLGVTVFGLVLIICGAIIGSVLKKKRIAAAAGTAATAATATVAVETELSDALLASEEAPAEAAAAAEETEV